MKKISLSTLILASLVLAACSAAPSPVEVKANPTEPKPIVATTAPAQVQPTSGSEKEVSFGKDIMPIFKKYADDKHGSKSSYSLESYEGVMKNVLPGNPEGSKLYQRLNGQGGPVMPPGNKLPDNLIQLIYDWIKQGAKNN